MILKVVSLAYLFLSCAASGLASTIELDTMVMQIRSQVDTDNSELLDQVLGITTKYMNDYFGAYYSNSEPKDYFSHAALTVNSFGIHGVTGSFITTMEFEGILFFNAEPAPSQEFMNKLLANAFQGLNLDLFLENILSSKNDFLAAMTHIIIEIDDATVTEQKLEETEMNDDGEDEGESGWDLDEWVEIAIYAAAGIVGMLLILGVCCICRCWCYKDKRQVEDDVEPVKLKSIEIPTEIPTSNHPVQRSSRRYKSRSFKKNNKDTFFSPRDRSPSPVRSLSSQDSSKFTYNPTGMSMSKASFSVGSMSNMNMDMPSFDIEAWQRQNTISPVAPAPFGHDISAIGDRDLCQIEEGDEDTFGSSRESGDQQYLSGKSLSALEVRNSRSRKIPGRAVSQPRTSYPIEERGAIDADTSSDVISDLINLSAQIDRHRRSRSRR